MRKLLIINDDTIVRQTIGKYLRQGNLFEPVYARTYEEALGQLEKRTFFGAICDLILPDAPYGEVVGACLKKNIPVIALTGSMDDDIRNTIMAQPILDYIIKESEEDIQQAVSIMEMICYINGKKALIVDDSNLSRQNIKSCLERLLFSVQEASSAEAALDLLKDGNQYSLIVVDHHMRGMSGVEFTKMVRTSSRKMECAIFGVTSRDSETVRYGFLKAGANDYFSLPLIPEEVNTKIFTYMRLHSVMDELQDINHNLQHKVDTAIQKNEEQRTLMIQQSKMASMGEMMEAISHQWKQPLSSISILSDLLGELAAYDELSKDHVLKIKDDIKTQVRFMTQTIQDFKGFLSPSKDKEPFYPDAILSEIGRMFTSQFEKSNVSISITSEAHFELCGYPNEFQQVLLNILGNAREAIVENEISSGKIECLIEQTDSTGIIRIKDNGGGVPGHLLPDKLFQSYITTKGEGGTGIGLQIAKTIIEQHMDGKLWAHNIDDGAEFVIELPLDNQEC